MRRNERPWRNDFLPHRKVFRHLADRDTVASSTSHTTKRASRRKERIAVARDSWSIREVCECGNQICYMIESFVSVEPTAANVIRTSSFWRETKADWWILKTITVVAGYLRITPKAGTVRSECVAKRRGYYSAGNVNSLMNAPRWKNSTQSLVMIN